MAEWEDEDPGGPPLQIGFNLSAQQFRDPELAEKLERWVKKAGLRPEQVTLEVTETSLMQAPTAIEETRQHGFQVYIDDFGTGYSTFAYLRDLDMDGLKVDMSFVQGIGRNDPDTALVETMITLGKRLGLSVVAEGIETEEQRQKLRAFGCERGQGFLFARPMPAEEMAARWREERS